MLQNASGRQSLQANPSGKENLFAPGQRLQFDGPKNFQKRDGDHIGDHMQPSFDIKRENLKNESLGKILLDGLRSAGISTEAFK